MSHTPMQWKGIVDAAYGSIAAFEDLLTIRHMLSQVKAKREELAELRSICLAFMDALTADYVADIDTEDKDLEGLQGELETWMETWKSKRETADA